MTAVEILIAVGIPTVTVVVMCVVDHLRGRWTEPDPLADLARRLDEGVV